MRISTHPCIGIPHATISATCYIAVRRQKLPISWNRKRPAIFDPQNNKKQIVPWATTLSRYLHNNVQYAAIIEVVSKRLVHAGARYSLSVWAELQLHCSYWRCTTKPIWFENKSLFIWKCSYRGFCFSSKGCTFAPEIGQVHEGTLTVCLRWCMVSVKYVMPCCSCCCCCCCSKFDHWKLRIERTLRCTLEQCHHGREMP